MIIEYQKTYDLVLNSRFSYPHQRQSSRGQGTDSEDNVRRNSENALPTLHFRYFIFGKIPYDKTELIFRG
ncbi:Uncharacterized protein dnm_034940 [Desulfonema magnum]|uniref:Uncharacterized protein n=1 Tax=Desulfonema magnum TaxID=45655 RepID=A0A975BLX5_9BACT|nr:Uncharacterized protein dnm_034940 [Desulfonema magnum]